MKITFIGAGNMGGAIARGLLTAGVCLPNDVRIIDRSESVRQFFKTLGVEAVEACDRVEGDMVILAVKPWQLGEVTQILEGFMGVVVSIAGGVSLAELSKQFALCRLVRVMPNTAVELHKGISFVASSSLQDAELVKVIFSSLGEAIIVQEEKFNACMALGSCGLAYALRFARASQNGATELGLPPALSQKIVAATLAGAAALLERGEHPEQEIDRITTPGGITIRGLNAMEERGFTNAVIQGLKHSL